MKKILSLMLVLVMCLSCIYVAHATEIIQRCNHANATYEAVKNAETDTKVDGEEIPKSHIMTCPDCDTVETQVCIDELPEDELDDHCDLCEQPLNHEDEWEHDENGHKMICSKNSENVYLEGEHKWGEWFNVAYPTDDATTNCNKIRVCEICGREEHGGSIIVPQPHIHDYKSNVVDPTCTEEGYTEMTCECGYSQRTDFVDPTGHNYGEWVVIEEATENAVGTKKRICQNEGCEAFETEEIEKLEHTHKYKDEVIAPTCEKKGYTKHTCDCGHSYNDAEVEATGHTFGEWKITKEASYTEEGEKTRTCSVCQKSETEKIDKVEHDCVASDKLKGEKKPTCTKDGYTGDTVCKLCDKVMKQGEKISPTGHDTKNAEIKNKKDATCTKKGYTGDKVCPICDEIIEKGKDIKKLDHDWDNKGFCKVCKADKNNPQTGDNFLFYIFGMGASSLGLMAFALADKKKLAFMSKH